MRNMGLIQDCEVDERQNKHKDKRDSKDPKKYIVKGIFDILHARLLIRIIWAYARSVSHSVLSLKCVN